MNGQHYYYGNIKAQTDNWDRDTIGVSYNYLKTTVFLKATPTTAKSVSYVKAHLSLLPKK